MKSLTIAAILLLIAPAGMLADDKTNPLYKEKSNKGENPLYTAQSVNNPGGSGTSQAQAKDVKQKVADKAATHRANHNTTRANRIQPAQVDTSGGGKGPQGATRAQDYNSSRSNTTSAVDVQDGDDDGDSISKVKVEKFKQRQQFGQTKKTKDRD